MSIVTLIDNRGYSVIALASYRQVDFPNDNSFPDEFDGTYFYADVFDGIIRYLSFENGEWIDREFASGFELIVDAAVGSDGALYILELNTSVKKIIYDGVTSIEIGETGPASFSLSQNYPNPFNPNTTIQYDLGEKTHVELSIFNLNSQKVLTLVNQVQFRGSHSVNWNGFDQSGLPVSSGIYFYQLEVDGKLTESRKMILIR